MCFYLCISVFVVCLWMFACVYAYLGVCVYVCVGVFFLCVYVCVFDVGLCVCE